MENGGKGRRRCDRAPPRAGWSRGSCKGIGRFLGQRGTIESRALQAHRGMPLADWQATGQQLHHGHPPAIAAGTPQIRATPARSEPFAAKAPGRDQAPASPPPAATQGQASQRGQRGAATGADRYGGDLLAIDLRILPHTPMRSQLTSRKDARAMGKALPMGLRPAGAGAGQAATNCLVNRRLGMLQQPLADPLLTIWPFFETSTRWQKPAWPTRRSWG